MFRDDHAVVTDKRVGPMRRRLGEGDTNCMIVDFLDRLDLLVFADRDRRRLGIFGVLPVEDEIIGCAGRAIVPFDALFQFPDDREAVLFQAVIFRGGNFRSEDRNQIAILVPSGERLIEEPAGLLILGADGEMRIEQGRRLPKQQLQRASSTGFWRLVGEGGGGLGDSRLAQHHAGHRSREADGDHTLYKLST